MDKEEPTDRTIHEVNHEWTAKFVADLVNKGRLTKGGNGWKLVSDAHNAALAAVCKVSQDSQRALWEAMKQLAAERERHGDEMTSVQLQLNKQLDAERENTRISQQGARRKLEETLQLRKQLAAEREIKSAEKLILLDEIAKNQQLREQLAAVVEALKKIKQVTDLGMIDQLADAALAKIGKL